MVYDSLNNITDKEVEHARELRKSINVQELAEFELLCKQNLDILHKVFREWTWLHYCIFSNSEGSINSYEKLVYLIEVRNLDILKISSEKAPCVGQEDILQMSLRLSKTTKVGLDWLKVIGYLFKKMKSKIN